MVVPKFSAVKFLEIAVVVVVVLIALDMFPVLRFWKPRPTQTAAAA